MSRPFSAWLAACLVSLLLALLGADFLRSVDAPLAHRDTVLVEINKGQSLSAIADSLHQRGMLARPTWFRLLAWANGNAARIKYGEYAIPPNTTPRQLLALFAAGKVRHYSLTIVEGWNIRQLLAALNREPALTHRLSGTTADALMAALGAADRHPEGRFFPDTYYFSKGSDDIDLLQRAYRKMQAVLAEAWQRRDADLPLHSPDEALILASIVEKETGLAAERPLIAGVFSRRLRQGMLLQTDPTVIYGMGEAYAGDIRKSDLQRDTPYNTYIHAGLPPTPIALPGAAALQAVLHPAGGNSLYFVARGDGGHIFSNTLAEHNQAVAHYLQSQQKRHD